MATPALLQTRVESELLLLQTYCIPVLLLTTMTSSVTSSWSLPVMTNFWRTPARQERILRIHLPAADSGNMSLSRWLAVPVRESGMADSPDFI